MRAWTRWKQWKWLCLGAIAAIAFWVVGQMEYVPVRSAGAIAQPVLVQSPLAIPTPAAPSPAPSLPAEAPTQPVAPATPLPVLPPPLPPASTAAPLPISGEYQDPGGRFKVGILKDYQVSPLAGSVLMESSDGSLAYTVVTQPPFAGSVGGFGLGLNADALAKAAAIVFQRGEGFQAGPAQLESGGGMVMNWTGNLTIGGQTQPIGGMIVARASSKSLVFLLIAATQAGAEQVPNAVSALANSLQVF